MGGGIGVMKFLVTGSQVYGPAKEDSDLDIVVMNEDRKSILIWLGEHNIITYQTPQQEDYKDDGGFYFDLFGIQINIICAKDEGDFGLWESQTEKLKKLKPIEHREERLDKFQRGFLK